jgi:hypothetical protein
MVSNQDPHTKNCRKFIRIKRYLIFIGEFLSFALVILFISAAGRKKRSFASLA